MTIRRFAGAFGSLLLTFGIGAIAPATGRAQTSLALPGEHSMVTLVGCFGWVHDHEYVLTGPVMGQTSVPQESCVVNPNDQMIKLQNGKKRGLTKTILGRYVEVSGTMGDEYPKHPERIRKLHVMSFTFPPVTPPVVASVRESETIMPAPVPPAVAPAPAPIYEQPIGTSGVMMKRKHLPKTASTLPLVGFIGLMSLLSGLTLHVFGQRSLKRG